VHQYKDQPDAHGEGRHGLGGYDLPSRVVAVVDQGPCGVAAVRRAIPIAASSRQPLAVLIVRPALPSFIWLTGLAVPPCWTDDFETEILALVANEVARSKISWTFDVLGPGSRLEPESDHPQVSDNSIVVVANHRRGWLGRHLWPPGVVRVPFVARRTTAPLLVVGCDRDSRWRHGRT